MNSKLRFYLRGLGIGIIVTALILSIVNIVNTRRTSALTDEQVRERALELGMVDGNSYSLIDATAGNNSETGDDNTADDNNLETDIENTADDNNSETDNENALDETDSNISDENTEADLDETDENKVDESTDGDEIQTDDENVSDTDVVTDNQNNEKEVTEDENQIEEVIEPSIDSQNEENITITITAGSGSEKVAAMLQNAGIISDSKDFNLYMEQNGYSRRIRVGTFTIPVDASYEEICKAITG